MGRSYCTRDGNNMSDSTQQSSGDQSPNIRTDSGTVSITYNAHKTNWLRVIPDYLVQLVQLLPAPRRFFARLDYSQKGPLTRGILFLTLSSLLAYFMRIPLAGNTADYWSGAVVSLVSYVVTGLLLGLLAFGCWRAVGGKASLRGHIVIFAYMAGVSTVLFALVALMAQGIMLIAMKEHFALYQEYMAMFFAGDQTIEEARFQALEQGWALKASMGVLLLGTLVILGWMAIGWRAMGDLNKLSGGRVAVSLLLFLILGLGVNELLAQWQAVRGVSVF